MAERFLYWQAMRDFQAGKKFPLNISDVATQDGPLCWRYIAGGKACIKDMGHDSGIHEQHTREKAELRLTAAQEDVVKALEGAIDIAETAMVDHCTTLGHEDAHQDDSGLCMGAYCRGLDSQLDAARATLDELLRDARGEG